MKDINLLPEDIKTTSTPIKTKGSPVKGIIITLIVLALMGVSLIAPKIYLKSVDMKIESLNEQLRSPIYREVDVVNKQIAVENGVINVKKGVLNSIDVSSYPMGEILNIVSVSTPKDCKINDMLYDGKSLLITGIAPSDKAAAKFMENMKLHSLVGSDGGNAQIIGPKDNKTTGYTFKYAFTLVRKDGK